MKICVIGTGYVGLVAGACLADMGNQVICIDNDTEKIEHLKKGNITIYEPYLEELVKLNFVENRLIFSTDIDYAIKESEVCYIAVGTPQKEDGSADLSYVYSVADLIAKAMNGYKVIVNKSTVPVGTAEKIKDIIKQNTIYPFDIVSNPEFLKQGNAVDDFLYPERIIIGSDSEKATKIMREIYEPYIRSGNRVIVMDIKSAEMTKYASNSFLAAKISFMNEMANLCEKVGADVDKVRLGMSTDSRIGNKFLFSGLGYGGSCFPKDIKALINTGKEYNYEMKIISAVDEINKKQRLKFINQIMNYYNKNIHNKIFAIWGLAFKPKTNDMRNAPSIDIINALLNGGAKVQVFDPKAIEDAKKIFGEKIEYSACSYKALENADGLIVITEWNEFRKPDFIKMKNLMNEKVIFDGRNIYDKSVLAEYGFTCFQIGKK